MGITRYGNQSGKNADIVKKPKGPEEDSEELDQKQEKINEVKEVASKEQANADEVTKVSDEVAADADEVTKVSDEVAADADEAAQDADAESKAGKSSGVKVKVSKDPTEELHVEIERDAAKATGSSGMVDRMKKKFKKEYHTPTLDANRTMEYKNFTEEIKQTPDWTEYKKGYGKAYKKVIIAAIPGIAFFVFVSIMNLVFHIRIFNIPIALSLLTWFINVWYTASLAAIPITLFIRYYSFRRLRNNYILFKKKEIVLYRETLNEIIDNEHVVLSEVCTVKFITPLYQETEGYFKIRGVVEVRECYNGKTKKKELREHVNIPKVFKGLEIIHEYAPDPIYNPDGKMFVWTRRRKDEKLFEWGFTDSKDKDEGKDKKCQKKKRWWNK